MVKFASAAGYIQSLTVVGGSDGPVGSRFKAESLISKGQEDSFFVVEVKQLLEQLRLWEATFPTVKPFYAVKCNNDPVIVETLASHGVNFDCASAGELQQIDRLVENVGNRTIYAHPCKQISHLKKASELGVSLTVVDNTDEVEKMKRYAPNMSFLVRIETDDSKSVCRLSNKFGANVCFLRKILSQVASLGLSDKCRGISYHVGSGCSDSSSFQKALYLARECFDIAEKEYSFPNFVTLDIGGGFPGDDEFMAIGKSLNPWIEKLFPITKGYKLIAEPGRFFVHQCATLYTPVIARRDMGETMMYYLNEGVYGAFNNLVYDHAQVEFNIMFNKNVLLKSQHFESSLWGPTCDGFDCLRKSVQLPKLDVGTWLYVENMGAYTLAAGSTFNGFDRSKVYYA